MRVNARLSSLRIWLLVLVGLMAITNLISVSILSKTDLEDRNMHVIVGVLRAKEAFTLSRVSSESYQNERPPKQGKRKFTRGDVRAEKKARHIVPKEKKELNLPIFVASLPKSGTTSTAAYFSCGGYRASHYWAKDSQGGVRISGQCVEQNIARKRKPFEGCGEYDVWADTGYAEAKSCFYPSIDGLDSIYEAYPKFTLLLVVRNTSSWYNSFHNWYDRRLFRQWTRCNATGMPNKNSTWRVHFHNYYEWHKQMVRDFAQSHPSITYVEVPLESSETPHILAESFGISSDCWGKCDSDYSCTYANETSNVDS